MIKMLSIFILITNVIQIICKKQLQHPFEHVIVLVMENHSYDHLLGFMDSPIGTLKEEPFCNTFGGIQYCTRQGAKYSTIPDPGHSFQNTNFQLYQTFDFPSGNQETPNMQGFAQNYAQKAKGFPQDIFDMYSPSQVPVISTLAKEFVTYNNWFSSIPTQTDPNKVFSHATTSNGNLGNCDYWYCSGWPFEHETIQTSLQKDGYTWSVHYTDMCEPMSISPMNQEVENFVWDQSFKTLYKKMHDNTLDTYTYLIPRFSPDWEEEIDGIKKKLHTNTQHPTEDIRYGEHLIKDIYENLRNSTSWDNTLLLIYYDEHGGFPDHVVPPMNVSNPSPNQESFPGKFDFNRLGIRVPAIAISPWLKKTVDSTQLEHASVPHTLKNMFNLSSDYLSIRDKEANNFLSQDIILKEKRQDCPIILPKPPSFEQIPVIKQKHKDEKEEQIDQILKQNLYVLGKNMVEKQFLNILEYKQIIDKIQTQKQGLQILQEMQILLGYRSKNQNFNFKYFQEKDQQGFTKIKTKK